MLYPRNDQMVSSLESEFQKSNDSSFAHESLISSYLALPGLRGFWPMSGISSIGTIYDMGGGDLHLLNVNTVPVIGWPMPAAFFQTSLSEVLYAADVAAFDIIGNEAHIYANWQGLTIGAWVKIDAVDIAQSIDGKFSTAAGNRSYLLHIDSSNYPQFYVSGDGTATSYIEREVELVADRWYFMVGRFDPSTEVKLWVDDVSVANTTSIPATIFNGTASFTVGANGTGPATFGNYFGGKISCAFLCTARIDDSTIRRLYYRTRAAFQNRSQW